MTVPPFISSIAVFCGSAPGARPEYVDCATELGALLAERGIRLIYGGGHVGLMGAIADSVLAHGGAVTGVIPTSLVEHELAHPGVADMRIVPGMHERKHLMADLADAFIALPGGPGTLEEISEQWTWAQLGYHRKPCVIVNVAGFYDSFLEYLATMVNEGFVTPAQAQIVSTCATPERALEAIAHYEAPAAKWAEQVH